MRRHRRLRPVQLLVLSFGTVILAGTLLLWLPAASRESPLRFVDALFTATSATCVTGLTVVDTGSHFTLFGQFVILTLIQIGGLGIMTLGTFFILSLGGRLGLRGRDAVSRTLTGDYRADLRRILRNVFYLTAAVEAAGAFLLTGRLLDRLDLPQAVYHGLFHSISAFCNAGFSLNADSFIGGQRDWGINLVLMALIVTGGLGFVVLIDVAGLFRRPEAGSREDYYLSRRHQLSLHSRLTLLFTAGLILTGAAVFLLLEWRGTLVDLSLGDKVIASFFQSVTARTAGFNTVPIALTSNATLFLLILLMFVGGAPGSCAGGIKVTTLGVLVTMAVNRIRGNAEVSLFRRRIPERTVSEAMGIATLGMTVVILFTFLLVAIEGGSASSTTTQGAFIRLAFESVSAFGTVGLSTGVTPELSTVGRLLITLLMFVGRLGPLTMALAVAARVRKPLYRYVEERVMVG
jgi:trk system potassium uptake protein TrkH